MERSRGGQDDPTPPDLSKASGVGFRLSYQPAFDGLRAVAIFLIILYHAYFARPTTHWQFPQISGAFLGVEMFFVQSGFLITALLIGEWEQTRRIVCATSSLAASPPRTRPPRCPSDRGHLVPAPDGGHVRSFVLGDAAASAAFVQNWRFVATSPRPPLTGSVVSLSVEGQVYVAIALLLACCWPTGGPVGTSPCLGPGDVRLRCVDGCPQRGSTPIVRAYAGPTPARRRSWWSDARGVASSGALFVTAVTADLRYLVWVAVPVAVG